MADVSCPMCGKENPAEADTCRHCQARLKPLGAQPGSSPADPTPPQGEDSADWLRDLFDEGSASVQTPQGDAPAEDSSDWLERIRQRTQEEQDALSKIGPKPKVGSTSLAGDEGADAESSEEAASASGGDLENWLKGLQNNEPPAPPAAPTAPAAPPTAQNISPEDDEWLRSLTARMEASQAMEQHLQTFQPNRQNDSELPPAQPAAPAEDLPDWLQDLRSGPAGSEVPIRPVGAALPPEAAETDDAPESADLPDWMQNLPKDDDVQASTQPPAAAGEGLPDWLREFQAEASDLPGETAAADAQDLPDWLQAAHSAAPTPADTSEPAAAPTEDLPDWLQAAHSAAPTPADTSGPAAAPTEDLPDWLSDLRGDSAPQGDAAAAEELPDWMNAAAVPDGEPQEAAQPPAPTPDWLPDLPAALREAPAEQTPAAGEDLSDWLHSLSAAQAAPAETQEQTALEDALQGSAGESATTPAQDAPQPPDWLKDFGALPELSAEDSPPTAAPDWLDALDDASALPAPADAQAAPAEELPAWLQSMQPSGEPPAETPAPYDAAALPDWMQAEAALATDWQQPSAADEPTGEVNSPFASNQMDDLLAGVSAEEAQAQPVTPEADGEALEPAQLPAWLQRLKPVEAAVAAIPAAVPADDQRIEKAGPLAGLRGVLPGEDLASSYRKPPVYTNKLQVTEKQHLHAGLLDGIVSAETGARAASRAQADTSQRVLRLLVAVLLIALVLIPGLTGFNLALPAGMAAAQPGLTEAFISLGELPLGSNVLLAADYEAGFSGEINMAALPVLKYLQTRQPKVYIVSTLPTGPALAEWLLSQASLSPTANFGYIAGGTQGLRRLASPASTLQPQPLQDAVPFPAGRLWSDPTLQGLKELRDFQRIVVLTDTLESARAWVEQVQPVLGPQTQILLVSSAQVAPLVRIYTESGQVSGLVSGLAGGAAFEQLAQQSGPAGASWTSYQLTLGAVIVLMVVGALVTVISSFFRRGKPQRKV